MILVIMVIGKVFWQIQIMTKNVILFGLGSIGLKHLALIQKEFKNTKLIILKSSKTNI